MHRSLPISIILTIVTFGLYGLYWFVGLTNDVNELSGRKYDTSGGKALFFTIITGGIYGIYWAYKMGDKMSFIKEMYYGTRSSDTILYSIVYLLGFPIIVYALVQYELNSIIEGKGGYTASTYNNYNQYNGNNQYNSNDQYNGNNQYNTNNQYHSGNEFNNSNNYENNYSHGSQEYDFTKLYHGENVNEKHYNDSKVEDYDDK